MDIFYYTVLINHHVATITLFIIILFFVGSSSLFVHFLYRIPPTANPVCLSEVILCIVLAQSTYELLYVHAPVVADSNVGWL